MSILKSATIGVTGLYAVAVIFSCLFINGVSSRSARSAERYENGTHAGHCDAVKAFFENKNISVNFGTLQYAAAGSANNTCGGRCCNRETEDHLRHQSRADFHNLIHHHSRSLQGLLATTADNLRETVTVLARQSENKTLTLFDKVYRGMAVLSKPSIRALYQAMVDYVSPSHTTDILQHPVMRETLEKSFNDFFIQLFPIAYHRAVNPLQHDFTDQFKKCLYERMDEIQPFGDIPKQILKSVGKSLEATRVLVQALTVGRTVLDRTDSVLFSGRSPQQAACYEAILRMTYCPKCAGIGSSVRPCNGFCTNVMRGCLTEPASELDLAWSGYVETVERLVVAVDSRTDSLGLNTERAVRKLDTHISDAIMHAMENGPALEEKVRNVCGRSELSTDSEVSSSTPSLADHRGSGLSHTDSNGKLSTSQQQPHKAVLTMQLHDQLGHFLASVERSRTFYGTLADAICEEYPDKHCWNGERVGEYTKTVVDSRLTAQRYNPEFLLPITTSTTTSYGNANTNELIEQLRHISQAMQSQLASAPDSEVLLSDEALDGSGSGARPSRKKGAGYYGTGDTSDDMDDHEDEEASGSGMGPLTTNTSEGTNEVEFKEKSGATRKELTPMAVVILVWFYVYV